jgi:hypothetical protein
VCSFAYGPETFVVTFAGMQRESFQPTTYFICSGFGASLKLNSTRSTALSPRDMTSSPAPSSKRFILPLSTDAYVCNIKAKQMFLFTLDSD